MMNEKQFGFTIYRKDPQNLHVLKDLLQLMKVDSGRKGNFIYVEDQNGLLPHLSLKENLQLVSPFECWKELAAITGKEHSAWINLIKSPDILASEAQGWERMLVGVLKSTLVPTEHLLINMSEDQLSPFMVGIFKKMLMNRARSTRVYLATQSPSLWLDCAHSLVHRKGFRFVVDQLDAELIKSHWASAA